MGRDGGGGLTVRGGPFLAATLAAVLILTLLAPPSPPAEAPTRPEVVVGDVRVDGAASPFVVPIEVSNTQSTPTGTYQQMVVVNSSRYSAYLNANVSNVAWRYPNGTAIYAWMESNNSNTSTRTTWWLRLYNIAADSNQTVYLDIYGKASYLLSEFGPTGEAPQLSATYGGLDDGARVFASYSNFSGTTFSSPFVGTYFTASIDNGVTFQKAWWQGPYGPLTHPGTQIVDAYGNWSPNGGPIVGLWVATDGVNCSSPCSNWGFLSGAAGVFGCGGTCGNPGPSTTIPASETTFYVVSNYINAGGNQTCGYLNYTLVLCAPASGMGPPNLWSTIGACATWCPGNGPRFDWWDARAYPPNGVMPAVTFLAPPAPTGFVVTVTTTNTLELGWITPPVGLFNETLYWGTTCSLMAPYDVPPYSDGSIGPAGSFAAVSAQPGTTYCFALSAWNGAGQSQWAYAIGTTRTVPYIALPYFSLEPGTPTESGGTYLTPIYAVLEPAGPTANLSETRQIWQNLRLDYLNATPGTFSNWSVSSAGAGRFDLELEFTAAEVTTVESGQAVLTLNSSVVVDGSVLGAAGSIDGSVLDSAIVSGAWWSDIFGIPTPPPSADPQSLSDVIGDLAWFGESTAGRALYMGVTLVAVALYLWEGHKLAKAKLIGTRGAPAPRREAAT